MFFHDLNLENLAAKLAGVVGALVSVRFLGGPISGRLVMAAGGAAVSFYLGPYASSVLSMPPEVTGFLLGLFGMSVISRFWEWLQTAQVGDFLDRWLPARKAPAPAPAPDEKKEADPGK